MGFNKYSDTIDYDSIGNMAVDETSARRELAVTVTPEYAVPYSADDKHHNLHEGGLSLRDRKTPAVFAKKEAWMKVWQRAEVTVICAVIVIAWGLLSLPIVFYNLPTVRGGGA